MNRRRFLGMTAGGLVLFGAGAGTGVWLFCPRRDEPLTAATQLAELARAMRGVAEVGRAWRRAHPGADVRERLQQSLGIAGDEVVTWDELAGRIGRRVESDFDDDRLFRHEGWWLSRTEAMLAALHVALLGPRVSEPREPEFDDAPEGRIVRLEHFDPRSLRQNEPLNHPDLPENVIWFATAEPPPPRLAVMLAGTRLSINARSSGFSIRLPDTLLDRLTAEPGDHGIWLYDPVAHRRQHLGDFTIRPARDSDETAREGFCEVRRWGPERTRVGETFNEQPDGASAFWIRVDCFPASTVVLFDGEEVPTTLRPADGLITTHMADPGLYERPGEYALELLDRDSGTTHPVGRFVVEP